VNRTYKDAGGNNVENVSFIDCSAWGKIGEVIHQYAKKGSGMLVSGRLDQRSWEDKDSGQKRSRVEIVVEDFNFLGDGGGRGNGGGGGGGATTEFASPEYSAPASRKSNDVAPTDIDDGPIDLSEIPF
jgi:single-strand DNA-binding protein